MGEEQVIRTIADKQDSIEISKNSKGDIQYAVKIYCNSEDLEKTYSRLKQIQEKIETDNKKN